MKRIEPVHLLGLLLLLVITWAATAWLTIAALRSL